MNDEVLTIKEVAAMLKVGEKTAYTLAQSRDLPGFKVGGQWRFRRSDIQAWISAQVERTKALADGVEDDA